MRAHGAVNPPGSKESSTVSEALRMLAEDVGLAHTTVRDYRWAASRRPRKHRRAHVSHTIHKILASLPDERKRFETAASPPAHPRAGGRRSPAPSPDPTPTPAHPRGGPAWWTHDRPKRIAGRKADTPESGPGEGGRDPRPGRRRPGPPAARSRRR